MFRWALPLGLLIGFDHQVEAHPHVFVEQRVTLLFDDSGLNALRVEWTFDELYSASLIADFMDRKRTPPNAAQIRAIEQQAFASAEQVNYFQVLKLDDLPIKVARHRDFAVHLDGPRVRYQFVLPVVAGRASWLRINALDEQWFIDFFPAKALPIGVEGPDGLGADCRMDSEPQKTALGVVETQIAVCKWPPKP